MSAQASLGARLAIGASAEIFAWGEEQVIKLFREGVGRQSVLNELERTHIAGSAGASAPAVFGTAEVHGRFGLMCERVRGTSLLEALLGGALDATICGRMLARLHVELHRLSAPDLPDQRARLEQDIAASAIDESARSAALQRLDSLSIDAHLCHGDFHPGNILLSAERPVIIDWYDATYGEPLADVAQTSLLLLHAELPVIPDPAIADRLRLARAQLHTAYLAEYAANIQYDRQQLDDWRLVAAAARIPRSRSTTERAALQAIVQRELTTR